MTILITGADGYLGWPTTLRTAVRTDDRVVAVDNFARRGWVEEVGSTTATPIAEMSDRLQAARGVHDVANVSFVEGDLTDRSFVDELLTVHEPETIVHAAAQPSAPYSQINGERANYTQHNNLQATRNLLWGLEEHGLDDTHFVETTTTGVYGAPEFPIPEGGTTMENRGERDDVPFPATGGSWYHQCYDPETEILTKDGWKPFPELAETDTVMSMDADTGETGWTQPSEIQEYKYNGEMVTVSNKQVDLKVTPNHRMLVGTSWANGGQATFEERRTVMRADELGTEHQCPCFYTSFPNWEGNDRETFELPGCDRDVNQTQAVRLRSKAIEMDAWLQFFGRWLAEGTVRKSEQTNDVRLSQSGAEQPIALFEEIGVSREKIRHQTDHKQEHIEFSDYQIATYLQQFKGQKHVPQEVKDLSDEHLTVLLDALVDGERTPNGQGRTFYTSSERLADDVQEIALKIGYGTTVHSLDRSNGGNDQTTQEYKVSIRPSWCVQTNRKGDDFEREDYEGKVFCCTVDGGIVLVRRDGNPVWCGNSKSFDAGNMRLANQQFDIPVSDVRTAIVYGTGTEETRARPDLATRFDFDYYFGTVAHRFCAQVVAGYPVTVYGKGEQRKPFVSLEDAVEGLARLATVDPDDRPEDLTVYNQVTRAISIVEIAETIAEVGNEFDLDATVEHFPNPRDEDETHKMEIENDRYADLIDGQSETFEESVRGIFETLVDERETIASYEDRFLPGVLEDRAETEASADD
jgi:nucleoside-diphosphate-sugar epimerase